MTLWEGILCGTQKCCAKYTNRKTVDQKRKKAEKPFEEELNP